MNLENLHTSTLEKLFGSIDLRIIRQDDDVRIVQLIDKNGISRTLGVVKFFNIDNDLLAEVHKRILDGGLLGKTLFDSPEIERLNELPYLRVEIKQKESKVDSVEKIITSENWTKEVIEIRSFQNTTKKSTHQRKKGIPNSVKKGSNSPRSSSFKRKKFFVEFVQ